MTATICSFRTALPRRVREAPRKPAFDQSPTRNQASGIIISADGYILTSAHVVTNIEAASVVLADSREFKGRVIGLDVRSDVALIKIDATGLTAARIGDPRRLAIGDWVAAIGATFGFEATVTAGIVSARRFFPGGLGVSFIQTDVATNPGSSGGPLFNLEGDVVGMSSMVYTSSGGYMGVSFALPIDVAMDVADRLRTEGRVVRGQLGARVQAVTLGLARAFGRTDAAGALVTRVDRGSAAERAGLRAGDIVLTAGDRKEMSYAELQKAVAATAPGTRLPSPSGAPAPCTESSSTSRHSTAARRRFPRRCPPVATASAWWWSSRRPAASRCSQAAQGSRCANRTVQRCARASVPAT
jgi:serine protease Do